MLPVPTSSQSRESRKASARIAGSALLRYGSGSQKRFCESGLSRLFVMFVMIANRTGGAELAGQELTVGPQLDPRTLLELGQDLAQSFFCALPDEVWV